MKNTNIGKQKSIITEIDHNITARSLKSNRYFRNLPVHKLHAHIKKKETKFYHDFILQISLINMFKLRH